MKKILFLTALIALFTATAADAEFSVLYEPDSKSVIIDGVMENSACEYAQLIIAPIGIDTESWDIDSISADKNIILKSIEKSGDRFCNQFGFTGDCGTYNAYLKDGEDAEHTVFTVTSDDWQAVVDKVNSASGVHEVSEVFSDMYKGKNADYFSEGICSERGKGYTQQGLLEKYNLYYGITEYYNGEIRLKEFLNTYLPYMSGCTNDIKTENELAAMDKLLKNKKLNDGSFVRDFEQTSIIAKIHAAGYYDELTEFLPKNLEKFGYSVSEFENLSAYYRDKVISDVFTKRFSAQNMKSLYNIFSECVKSYTKRENNQQGGGTGGGGNGSGNGKNNYGIGLSPAIAENKNAEVFSDINEYSWAKESIERLYSAGGISGYGDGSFQPGKTITRAEFVKMCVFLINAGEGEITEFEDVSDNSWYKPYVDKAYSAGVINGYGKKFCPDNEITRQDCAVILYRILTLSMGNISGEYSFADSVNISEYAAEAVGAMANKGIINGYEDGSFRPYGNLTRAEAACLLIRIKDIIG